VFDLKTGTETNVSKGIAGYDQDPVFSPDGRKLVWRSMARDGFEADKDRIMIYDFATAKYADYSENFDQNANNFAWTADSKTLYFLSPIHGTVQIYTLNTENKQIKPVSSGQCDYLSVALSGKDIITSKQSMTSPTEIFKIDATGKETQLSFTNKEILKDVKSAKVEERWMTTTDNKKMLVWVVYPPDFNPNKKYPALLFCEGGPQSMVSQFFSYRWNMQIMAANDYIVIAPNRRGLPGFGQEWNDAISQDWGGMPMQDILACTDAMLKEPYIDTKHVTAIGASAGGYAAFWLAGNHKGRFSSFVSHCGVFNLESMYGATEELWFTNWENGGPYWDAQARKNYDKHSPHRYAQNWDTPILIITGEKDYRVPYTQSLEAFTVAQVKGIPSKLIVYPDENHWVLHPQEQLIWFEEFFDFIGRYRK